MAGEALTELAAAVINEDTIEDIGNKVEKVTKQIPMFRYAVIAAFFLGWGLYFFWIY